MTNAPKIRPLHEMYSQDEIDKAEAYVTNVYKNGPNIVEENPVAQWGDFAALFDTVEPHIEPAIRAILARRHYAVNGPQDPDLQPLPLGRGERSEVRKCGATQILYWFARSLAAFHYDIIQHPSFYEYACGTLALEHESSQLLEELRDRFPPRVLPGLDRVTGNWNPATLVRAKK